MPKNNFLRRLAQKPFKRLVEGRQMQVIPAIEWKTFRDFRGGFEARDNRTDIPENSSGNSLDIEPDARDRLVRAPGTLSVEDFSDDGRAPQQVILQASLDYSAELVFIDPPYLGVRSSALTTWTDEGLDSTLKPFGNVNFGGTLIFSSGLDKVYARQNGASTLEILDEGVPADAYANFAARIFAGNVIVDGKREPLGVVWTGSSSDYKDWQGLGAGFEILVGNSLYADKIVSMRSLGFATLAILCRRSLWVGTKTDIADHPAEFELRADGPGALHDGAVSVTPYGVMYLSDGGIYLFNGSVPELLSEPINALLLPLDFTKIYSYSTYYHPGDKALYLFTPTETWIFEVEKKRWKHRSLIAHGASIFGIQLDAETWETITGTWADQEKAWGQLAASQTDTYDIYTLTQDAAGDARLGREDSTAEKNIDIDIEPLWEFPMVQGPYINKLVTNSLVLVEYFGSGTLQFWVPDINGKYDSVVEKSLSSSGDSSVSVIAQIPFEYTGMGLGLLVKILNGSPKISKAQLGYVQRGPRIETGTFAAREYYEDFLG